MRVLIMRDQDPVVKELCEKLDTYCKKTRERYEFLRKQQTDIEQRAKKESGELWDQIKERLTTLGIKYDPDTEVFEMHENAITANVPQRQDFYQLLNTRGPF